jgi:hypothetical protein
MGGIKGPCGISIQEKERVRVGKNPQVQGIFIPGGDSKFRMKPVAKPGPAVFPGAGYFFPGLGENIRGPAETFFRGHGFEIEFSNFPVPPGLQKMKVLAYPVFYLWN